MAVLKLLWVHNRDHVARIEFLENPNHCVDSRTEDAFTFTYYVRVPLVGANLCRSGVADFSPPPCGEGSGAGVGGMALQCPTAGPPTPSPPQGGRESRRLKLAPTRGAPTSCLRPNESVVTTFHDASVPSDWLRQAAQVLRPNVVREHECIRPRIYTVIRIFKEIDACYVISIVDP